MEKEASGNMNKTNMISRNWKSNYWKIDTGPKRQIMKRWSAVFLQILLLDFLRNMQLGLPLKKRFLAFVATDALLATFYIAHVGIL